MGLKKDLKNKIRIRLATELNTFPSMFPDQVIESVYNEMLDGIVKSTLNYENKEISLWRDCQ